MLSVGNSAEGRLKYFTELCPLVVNSEGITSIPNGGNNSSNNNNNDLYFKIQLHL